MTHNNIYNLCRQLTEENTSLWRIRDEYIKDATGKDELQDFWRKLEKDKETHILKLQELIKKYL